MRTLFSAVSAVALMWGASQALAQGAPPCPAGQTCAPAGATGGAQGGATGGATTGSGAATSGAAQGGATGGATTGGATTGQAQGGATGGATTGTTTRPAQGGGAATGGASGGATTGGAAQGGSQGTSGGGTNVDINVTVQQRTEIRQVILASKPAPVANVTFAINVGVAVPQTIVLHECPARVIEFASGLRTWGCRYFVMADGRIVIVRNDTRAVVLVITG